MNYFLKAIEITMRMRYGDPRGRVVSRGKWPHATKSGPGRRRLPDVPKPAGHKLSRKAGTRIAGRGL